MGNSLFRFASVLMLCLLGCDKARDTIVHCDGMGMPYPATKIFVPRSPIEHELVIVSGGRVLDFTTGVFRSGLPLIDRRKSDLALGSRRFAIAGEKGCAIYDWSDGTYGSLENPVQVLSEDTIFVSLSPSGLTLVVWSVDALKVVDAETGSSQASFAYTAPGWIVWKNENEFVIRETGPQLRRFMRITNGWDEYSISPLDDRHGRRIECFYLDAIVTTTINSEIVTRNSILSACDLATPIAVDQDHLLLVCDRVAAVYSGSRQVAIYENSDMLPLALVATMNGWEYYYIKGDTIHAIALNSDFTWGSIRECSHLLDAAKFWDK